jgi:hypothetical protein
MPIWIIISLDQICSVLAYLGCSSSTWILKTISMWIRNMLIAKK